MRRVVVLCALGAPTSALLAPAPIRRRATTAARAAAAATDAEAAPPLSAFAARLDGEVVARFGESGTARVREAWALMDREYVHEEALIDGHEYMKQEARSYLPGLSAVPFWETGGAAWARRLEDDWAVVRDEFEAVALKNSASLEKKGNNVWAAAADAESAGKYGQDWRTLVLMDRTTWDPTNCALFPRTAKLLDDAGVPCVEAFFASMKPRSKINPHTDSCNFILTSHLGLRIPERCSLTVGDETREWTEGRVSLFDTSIFHDAVNDSDEDRYILMLRVWHPELTAVETKALQFLFDVLDVPDLVSDDPVAVFRAEHDLSVLRTRPEERARLAAPEPQIAPPRKPAKGKKKKGRKGKAAGFGVPL